MANIASAKKRVRQNEKRRSQNIMRRASIRTLEKKIRKNLELNNKKDAEAHYKTFSSFLDKAAKRNIVHPNKASRKKSRIALLIIRHGSSKKTVPKGLDASSSP